MSRRDIVIGAIVLVVILGYYFWRRGSANDQMRVGEPTPGSTLSTESKIEDAFKVNIPDDVDKAELRDVGGGTGSGIGTRKFENGRFEHSLLVDLPDPASGKFYQGWIVRAGEGDENYSLVSTGRLQAAKGGFMLNFTSSTNFSDHGRVLVTLEGVNDQTPETRVLEGTF